MVNDLAKTARLIYIVGGQVHTPGGAIDGGVILVRDNAIAAVGRPEDIPAPEGARVVHAAGLRVVPGLVDLHLHGIMGHDIEGGDLNEISRLLARCGITGFLATAIPAPLDRMVASVRRIASGPQPRGARLLGIHLEGPYLSPYYRGSLPKEFFLESATPKDYLRLIEAGGGSVRIVTLAPELPGALDLIRHLISSGVLPSAGHSEATFAQVGEAVAAGLCHATHTFNAMRPFGHREPGATGAVLYFDEITAQLIADGMHVHPTSAALLIKLKGVERTCLISDATALAGLPPGSYEWRGAQVASDGRAGRLRDGTLAGSVVTLESGLRNLVEQVGLSFEDALATCTNTPAAVLGLNSGVLAAGKDADIALFDPHYRCHLAIVQGRIVHSDL